MRKIKIKSKINKNTIDVIIFTYKRAILLDACIKSIIKFSSNINYPINIIYNYDKDHHKSYVKLKKIYGNKIKFHTRNKKNIFNDIRLLLRPLNIIWIYKWKRMLNNYSNFKDLLENILRDSKSELTMLCTDDTFFYKKNHINKKICEKIIKDGKNSWFRPNFGSELEKSNFTTKIFFNKKKYLNWNANNKNITYFMMYNFQVEGSVYNTNSLLSFLKPFIYYNPTTLEAIGYKEAKYRNFFNKTYSPFYRTVATYELNSVQKDTKLRFFDRPQVNPNHLMKLFLKNYKLIIKLNDNNFLKKNEFGNLRLIPKKVYLQLNSKIFDVKKLVSKFKYKK
jgi:hypothetical protein